MSPAPIVPRPPRRAPGRSAAPALGLALAIGAASLVAPTAASAAKVRSHQPWKATNTYLVTADVDGRATPQKEPRAAVDFVKKGSWVRISCQTRGGEAYGSNLWSKVGRYYVPDQLLKTYTDGSLQGVPSCRGPQQPNPPQQPQPQPPAASAHWRAAQLAAFGPYPAGTARVVENTQAKTGRGGVVMLRFFIPNSQAGGRLLKGDNRGWSSDPSHGVASRASLFWDTESGKVSLAVAPTHVADFLPKHIWGAEYRDFGKFPGGVLWPKKISLPDGVAGGSAKAALPLKNFPRESSVKSTDLHARGTNTAAIYGSGDSDTVYAKVSLLNSVTNGIDLGAWSVDTKVTIKQNPSGTFKIHTDGNGYPAVEAYYYPKALAAPLRTIFLRRVHPWAYSRDLRVPFLKKINTGLVDPGGGIAALDKASDLGCDNRPDGGSDCERDDMGLNPLPELISPNTYGTSRSDRAG